MSDTEYSNCPDEGRCENKDIECDNCTRAWYFEEPCDHFMEKEEEEG